MLKTVSLIAAAAVLAGAAMLLPAMTPEAAAVELFLADVFGPGRGDDGTDGGAAPGGPEDGPRGGGDGNGQGSTGGRSQGRTALGRKGKRGFGRTSAKTPEKPLAQADLERVRKLAEALGGVDKLSARNVREAVGGCAQEYAVRLRNAVQAEQSDTQ